MIRSTLDQHTCLMSIGLERLPYAYMKTICHVLMTTGMNFTFLLACVEWLMGIVLGLPVFGVIGSAISS